MKSSPAPIVRYPWSAWTLDLRDLPSFVSRLTLRSLLGGSAGLVSLEGADRLAAAPRPAIFALCHQNSWEAVLAPATLIAGRGGRRIRFMVDWMLADLPWSGWLVRQLAPIPIYRKRARLGLLEGHRQRRQRAADPVGAAVSALAAGDDLGIYPEGRRNSDPFLLERGRLGLGYVALRSGCPVVPVGVDFPARDYLLRTPRAGRFTLRVGDSIEFPAERSAWQAASGRERLELERRSAPAIVDRVLVEIARLSRKLYIVPSRARRKVVVREEPPKKLAITVARVVNAADRAAALGIVEEVYRHEKGWLRDVDGEIPTDPTADPRTAWLLARYGTEPAGVVRLQFDPALDLPAEAGVELEASVDLAALARAGRFVEVGRLTIRPAFRRRPAIVLELMRSAVEEVLGRGYSHLLTAVFEDDPHSPYQFHTRVLGFERIGSHRRGELRCESRRILLVLDLHRATARLDRRGGRLLERLRGAGSGGLVAAS